MNKFRVGYYRSFLNESDSIIFINFIEKIKDNILKPNTVEKEII